MCHILSVFASQCFHFHLIVYISSGWISSFQCFCSYQLCTPVSCLVLTIPYINSPMFQFALVQYCLDVFFFFFFWVAVMLWFLLGIPVFQSFWIIQQRLWLDPYLTGPSSSTVSTWHGWLPTRSIDLLPPLTPPGVPWLLRPAPVALPHPPDSLVQPRSPGPPYPHIHVVFWVVAQAWNFWPSDSTLTLWLPDWALWSLGFTVVLHHFSSTIITQSFQSHQRALCCTLALYLFGSTRVLHPFGPTNSTPVFWSPGSTLVLRSSSSIIALSPLLKKEGIIYFFESTPTTRKEKLGHAWCKERKYQNIREKINIHYYFHNKLHL